MDALGSLLGDLEKALRLMLEGIDHKEKVKAAVAEIDDFKQQVMNAPIWDLTDPNHPVLISLMAKMIYKGLIMLKESWSRAYINNLPDSAFAWIDPKYGKESDDKGLRHLPHHDATGKVDRTHVIAAMAALLGGRGGVDIPESAKRIAYNRLKEHYAGLDLEPPEMKSSPEEILQQFGEKLKSILARWK